MPINDVGDAMREMKAGSKHIKTRAQAIAVGLKKQRQAAGNDKGFVQRKAFGGGRR